MQLCLTSHRTSTQCTLNVLQSWHKIPQIEHTTVDRKFNLFEGEKTIRFVQTSAFIPIKGTTTIKECHFDKDFGSLLQLI